MKEDLNPKPPTGPKDGPMDAPDGELARALEELLSGASQHGGTSAADAGNAQGDCPEPGVWIELATGETRQAEVDALLAHAGGCGVCAARLGRSLRLFTENTTPEEAVEAASLASATPDWQRSLAAKLAQTPHRSKGEQARKIYLWAGAGMAAALLLAAGLFVWRLQTHTPERLLAEAYTHSRIFDMRMPGAGFAEVTPEGHLRGGSGARESSKLLDARARIERKLESSPEDPHWLQLEARADVEEEKFDAAIDILDRLLASGPVTPALLLDDATAYFERGAATGSENDRAMALEYLRRADELAPGDPVVLFNEAVAMEDRGQMMNAVETWNRYLRFERDASWQSEGRRRLQVLEQKLNRLKTHQSRMEQHLATPEAMRAMAADSAALAALDEELSTTLLPRILDAAFPMPVDRSRGSPQCEERCQAARSLLYALAASLERNHQDPWLTQFLPSSSTSPDVDFIQAAHALSQAIGADAAGNYAGGRQWSLKAIRHFHGLGNVAGEDRATVEQAYALQVLSNVKGCYQAAHPLLGRNPRFAWIQIQDFTEDSACDASPETGTENNPAFQRAASLAQQRHYALLELRARNWLGAAAVDTGDVENTWRIYLGTIHKFYAGDYPASRLYSTLSGLEEVEESTPRVHHTLLLQREALGVLELSQNRGLIPAERMHLAAVAIRAGAVQEAQDEMRRAQQELEANGGGKSVSAFLVENENAMANLYLDRRDLASAAKMLDATQGHMAGENNSFHRREYALARGRLEVALGHPKTAESLMREALLEEERLASKAGTENIVLAKQDRDLYAVLAAVWLQQGRSGEETLALWERYRLRILGKLVSPCADKGLACLKPALTEAMARLGRDQVLGQVVLFDRALLYRATSKGVAWSSVPVGHDELEAAVAPLERAASSPETSQASVDRAARRVGDLLFGGLREPAADGGQLLLEPDTLLGNLPWPAVETVAGPIGLHYDLEEVPSLLLAPRRGTLTSTGSAPSGGDPLVVGASLASGENNALPEVLEEAKAVARFGRSPSLLVAGQATAAQVTPRLGTASAIHFAGHATRQDGATRLLLAPSALATDKAYLDSDLLRSHPPRAARLAVFSACSSGKKDEEWNRGMGDIVDTLAGAGVPEVVATRWQIDSASAVPMMDAFYGGLARGLTVPRALTAARQSLIRDARYRHPYYWAAYYSAGMGRTDMRALFTETK